MRKLIAVLSLVMFATAALAQSAYHPPTVYIKSGQLLKLNWTGGNVLNGGKSITISQQTIGQTVDANLTDCSAPLYASCGMIYVDSGGTTHYTTSIATASGAGSTIIAFVTTDATKVLTVAYPWQNGAPFSALANISAPSINSCGTTTTCAQTPVAGFKIRYGQCSASSATTCVVTALDFTSATSYSCSVTDMTTAANNALKITQAATTLTITTTSSSDTFSYICGGS